MSDLNDINNNAGKTTYGMLFFLHPYYIICTVQIVIDSIVKRPHLRAAHFCFKPFLTNHSSKTGVWNFLLQFVDSSVYVKFTEFWNVGKHLIILSVFIIGFTRILNVLDTGINCSYITGNIILTRSENKINPAAVFFYYVNFLKNGWIRYTIVLWIIRWYCEE